MYPAVKILDLNIFSSTKLELLKLLDQQLSQADLVTIFTPNSEQLVLAQDDQEFKDTLKKADFLLPDGIGLILASKILAMFHRVKKIKQRIAGVDLVHDLLALARERNWKVLIIGGRDYQVIEEGFKNSKLMHLEAYSDIKHPKIEEEMKIKKNIMSYQPELVFVAFGAPFQENWIISHENLLKNNKTKIAMAVGGSFDFLSGKVKRAPKWMQKIGLEWLYRLIQEPWRWKRQLSLIKFSSLIFKETIKK